VERNKYRELSEQSASWLVKANKALDADDDQLASEILARKESIDNEAAASKARIDVLEPQVAAMKKRIAQATGRRPTRPRRSSAMLRYRSPTRRAMPARSW